MARLVKTRPVPPVHTGPASSCLGWPDPVSSGRAPPAKPHRTLPCHIQSGLDHPTGRTGSGHAVPRLTGLVEPNLVLSRLGLPASACPAAPCHVASCPAGLAKPRRGSSCPAGHVLPGRTRPGPAIPAGRTPSCLRSSCLAGLGLSSQVEPCLVRSRRPCRVTPRRVTSRHARSRQAGLVGPSRAVSCHASLGLPGHVPPRLVAPAIPCRASAASSRRRYRRPFLRHAGHQSQDLRAQILDLLFHV
jgi:hypothetical protein